MKIHPDLYHGKNKKKNFFEGWYFKIVDKTGKNSIAFIPGISFGKKKAENHSFVQVVDAINNSYHYYRFKPDSFSSNEDFLHVKIDNNSFSYNKISINLFKDNDFIKGTLQLSQFIKWPDSKINPGSMGFYNHLSFMECYSQVCAVDGTIITGSLEINGHVYDFSEGKFYIEKNWGNSFPSSWLWIQSNNFTDNRASVTCSLGIVPFPIIKKFRGFLIGVTIDTHFYSFTTINRSSLSLKNCKNDLILTSINKNLTLILKTKTDPQDFLSCLGPRNGNMVPLVDETLRGEVEMTLIDHKKKKIIYHGVGKSTGIEYGGNQNEILDAYCKKSTMKLTELFPKKSASKQATP